MIRSLAAVIIAVIAGLSAAKLMEGGGAAVIDAPAPFAVYSALVSMSWFGGAFVAALLAMLIGKRWAPLGILAAASIFLGAVLALFSNPLGWWMWPAALVATALGGFGAVRILGAGFLHPDIHRKDGLFDE